MLSMKTSYLVIAEPPLSDGASQDISIREPFAKTLTGALGASGAMADRKLTGSDGSLSPMAFCAMTR